MFNRKHLCQTMKLLKIQDLISLLVFVNLTSGNVIANEKIYITCQYFGELGNQMFEVANAVGYALDHQGEAVFENFNGAAGGELNYRYIFHRLTILPFQHNLVFENQYQLGGVTDYHPLTCEPNKNLRFVGHFVNEKYFVRHKEHIRQLFAPSEEILNLILSKYHDLLRVPTVAVHVRTFIRDGQNPEKTGLGGLTWDYFKKAMDYFSDDYTFLIFSDDIAWTKIHFPMCRKNIKFIEGNPHYFDLYFMSLCHHQIIAPNSTFSWWAAWLNLKPDKIVIAPHVYYGNTEEYALPPEWIRVYSEPFSLNLIHQALLRNQGICMKNHLTPNILSR